SEAELSGAQLTTLFDKTDQVSETIEHLISGEDDHKTLDLKIKKRHNDTVDMSATFQLMSDGKHIACSIYPKEHSFSIGGQVERIDRLAMLGELSTGIAHEIRNPLAGIKSSAEVIGESLSPGDFRAPLIERVIREVDRSNELLKRFFDFARPVKPNPEFCSINEIIEAVALLIDKRLNRKKIRLERTYAEKLPQIYVDSAQIEQILMNLILNAAEAIERDGKIALRSRPVVKEGSLKGILIEVQDNGCGIAPDNLEKIFNPFYTGKSKGVGLGLSICMRLIRENGGQLTVESTQGEGSIFYLIIPVKYNLTGE
ncbi:MAG: hypothetical protein GF313_11655, partial [Caldithrix sp.]|nr:hypothetical protein [Caldithrix sp.]